LPRILFFQAGKYIAEQREPGDGNARVLSTAKRFQEHGFEFEREAVLEIQQGGGFVGAHLGGVLDHLVHEFQWKVVALGAGGGDDFVHEFADEGLPARVGEEFICG